MRNLHQARELIASFKAGGSGSDQQKAAQIRPEEVIEEGVATLHPMLKKPARGYAETTTRNRTGQFSGPLWPGSHQSGQQRRTARVRWHGHGTITIEAYAAGSELVEIQIRTTAAASRSIICRRFSTRSSPPGWVKGGSGLGLHIVYNIVTRVLGGRSTSAAGRRQAPCSPCSCH